MDSAGPLEDHIVSLQRKLATVQLNAADFMAMFESLTSTRQQQQAQALKAAAFAAMKDRKPKKRPKLSKEEKQERRRQEVLEEQHDLGLPDAPAQAAKIEGWIAALDPDQAPKLKVDQERIKNAFLEENLAVVHLSYHLEENDLGLLGGFQASKKGSWICIVQKEGETIRRGLATLRVERLSSMLKTRSFGGLVYYVASGSSRVHEKQVDDISKHKKGGRQSRMPKRKHVHRELRALLNS